MSLGRPGSTRRALTTAGAPAQLVSPDEAGTGGVLTYRPPQASWHCQHRE